VDGDDTLLGGLGNDQLFGEAGNDHYLFSLGHGRDRLWDVGNGLDTMVFDTTVTRSHIAFWENPTTNHLIIDYGQQAGTDQVTVEQWRQPAGRIERFELQRPNTPPLTLTDTAIQQTLQQLSLYASSRGLVFSNLEQILQDTGAMQLFANAWV
jgi:Ca2+-binding RTX toxin-like protein